MLPFFQLLHDLFTLFTDKPLPYNTQGIPRSFPGMPGYTWNDGIDVVRSLLVGPGSMLDGCTHLLCCPCLCICLIHGCDYISAPHRDEHTLVRKVFKIFVWSKKFIVELQ